MIEVSSNFKFAALNGTTNNELHIEVFGYNPDGSNLHIRNKNIVSESMVIEQSICDESDLKFGGCIASQFEIDLSNAPDLTGKYITVSLTQTAKSKLYPSTQTFPGADTYPGEGKYIQSFDIFSGEVYSCKSSKNHLTRKLVAYDRFYWRGSIDCTNWYRSLYSDKVQISLYELRKAICSKFRLLEADESVTLPADNLNVKMIEDNVTVTDLLRMICEFNGVFLFFNGRGNLEYRSLNKDTAATEDYIYYMDVEREDFTKTAYTGIYFNLSKGGWAWYFDSAEDDSLYFEEDNALITTGYDDPYLLGTHLGGLGADIKPNFNIEYTPVTLSAQCRLWVQLGDRIKFKVKWYSLETDKNGNEYAVEHEDELCSYVLSRKISGIQALKDEISAEGEDIRYTEDSNFDEIN